MQEQYVPGGLTQKVITWTASDFRPFIYEQPRGDSLISVKLRIILLLLALQEAGHPVCECTLSPVEWMAESWQKLYNDRAWKAQTRAKNRWRLANTVV